MWSKELTFYSLVDFFPKKELIKVNYENLSSENKRIYKMYVYSLCFEKETIKDLIWEYLNGWEESQFDLAKEYRKRTQKRSN